MAKHLQLRPARTSDLTALLALESLFPGDRLSLRQLRRHLASARNLFRVADEDSRVLGYALTFLRRGSRDARLYSLVVDPAERGRGLAWALLQDAETQRYRKFKRPFLAVCRVGVGRTRAGLGAA